MYLSMPSKSELGRTSVVAHFTGKIVVGTMTFLVMQIPFPSGKAARTYFAFESKIYVSTRGMRLVHKIRVASSIISVVIQFRFHVCFLLYEIKIKQAELNSRETLINLIFPRVLRFSSNMNQCH